MSVRMILLPVFVHVALVFFLLFWSGRGNRSDADGSWRDELALPVLFYVLTIAAWQTQFADILFILLAWIFVALRVIRAVRNGGTDSRPLAFASEIVLAVMWLIYALRLLLAF